MNFAKFLRTVFLQNTSGQLLLGILQYQYENQDIYFFVDIMMKRLLFTPFNDESSTFTTVIIMLLLLLLLLLLLRLWLVLNTSRLLRSLTIKMKYFEEFYGNESGTFFPSRLCKLTTTVSSGTFVNEDPVVYLKEKNCLRDKFSRFSRIFPKFAKLNPHEKSTGSQFAKLNSREKNFFFRFSELAKLTFLH